MSLRDVLSWFPPDTETIVGANGPFVMPDLRRIVEGPDNEHQFSRVIETQSRLLAMELATLKNGGLNEMLSGKMITLAIEGSRHFQAPAALGAMRFEGCDVIIPVGKQPVNVRTVFSKAKQQETIEGTAVAIFEESREEDTWTTLVAFPRQNVVLIASSLSYLREVLSRMRQRNTPAFPQNLPEWRYVPPGMQVWGMRHYARSQTTEDPSTPFKDGNDSDRDAIGLAFGFNLGVPNFRLTYLSGSTKSGEIVSNFTGFGELDAATRTKMGVRIIRRETGVTDVSARLHEVDVFYRVLFGLKEMLGHAVYL